jgi:hypothetical protein
MIDRRIVGPAGCLALVALLLATDCGKKSTQPEGDTGPKTPIMYPLAVGNQWIYGVQVVSGLARDTLSRTDEIVGTDTRGGTDYFRLTGIPSHGSAIDTTYMRQSDEAMFIFPDISFDTSPEGAWVARHVGRSLPWRLADFTGPTGKVFQYGPVDTIFDAGDALELTIVTSSVGRTSLTVPAGTYTDVYEGRMTVLAVLRYGSVVAGQISSTKDLFIKDGVGLIKEVEEDRAPSQYGEIVTTQTSVLRSTHFVEGRNEVEGRIEPQ